MPTLAKEPDDARPTSRIPGFYELDFDARLRRIARFAGLGEDEVALLRAVEPRTFEAAGRMVENLGGVLALPVGFATNFRVDGRDRLVPMAIEESSVVAAASHAAKLLRGGPGIETEADPPVMIGQILLEGVADRAKAGAAVLAASEELLAAANATDPRLIARGGGARGIELRELPTAGDLAIHLLVDVQDAMGANLVNTMAEALAPRCAALTGGSVVMAILSNLADRRLVRATGRIPLPSLPGGAALAARIATASRFAETDPYRAATHNKGVMNGIDAVLIAAGQDWRAVEAGAHAYAARSGPYRSLTTWRVEDDEIVGRIELPIQAGTVGGATRVHPVVPILLKVLGIGGASELARIAAAVGLAQNLAAVRALVGEGIQRGHMTLHARNMAASAGAVGEEVEQVVAEMVRRDELTHSAAEQALEKLRKR